MTPLAVTDQLFFERADADIDQPAARRIVEQALAGSDDGELFLEYRESEQISLDDGRIRSAGFDSALGFGLRAVAGEATGYAHAAEATGAALPYLAGVLTATAILHLAGLGLARLVLAGPIAGAVQPALGSAITACGLMLAAG